MSPVFDGLQAFIRREQAPALRTFVFLRIVGSGFCPILSQRERRDGARRAPPNSGGRPRAMLAPDASVWDFYF